MMVNMIDTACPRAYNMDTTLQGGVAMSLFKKKAPSISFDPKTQRPAVRKSICMGEMTVGFIELSTGKFRDIMRVDGQAGLEAFMKEIGVTEIKTIY